MGVPWHSLALRHLLEVDREIEASARGQLADELALQFLPGRLARHDLGLPRRLAAGQLRLGDQDIGGALADIDPYLVAGLEQRQSAADRGLGRGVEDRGTGRRAALAAIAD